MSNGFVKTNRDLVNYEKWESLSFSEKGMLHELILRAGWKEGEIGKISLSVNSLSKSTGTARNTVTSLLLKLQKKGFLAVAFSKESATVIELDQTELQKISGSSQDLAQNLNKACSKTKQDLAQNLNKACSKTKQENALHHINIEEEKNIEDILPTTSQDIPPYVDEAEEFFAMIYDGSAPLEPMDCIPDFEDYQQATEHTQASRDTQAQGTLPSLPPVEKASEKQRKPKEKHLPQWEQDFEDWWKVYLSLSKGIEGKGGKAVGKTEARKAWEGLRNKRDLLSLPDMIEGLKKYATLNGWERNSQKYILHASTFLNQKRWEDEVSRNSTSYASSSVVTRPQPQPQAYAPWHEILEKISDYGPERLRDARLNDATKQAIIAIGGWVSLCKASEREMSFKANEYAKIVRRGA